MPNQSQTVALKKVTSIADKHFIKCDNVVKEDALQITNKSGIWKVCCQYIRSQKNDCKVFSWVDFENHFFLSWGRVSPPSDTEANDMSL